MCTVSFIAYGPRVYLTSNRDEHHARKRALEPAAVHTASCSLLFPKDPVGGGTWIAARDNGDAAVLLNGAATAHRPSPPYRHSRGLIVPQVLQHADPYTALATYPCEGLEPFTLILFAGGGLYQCRWNGEEKQLITMDPSQSYIWSSATLYAPGIVQKRNNWFRQWLVTHPEPAWKDILHFHRFAGEGDRFNDLFMNRNNEMLTNSITGIVKDGEGVRMHYWDALEDRSCTHRFVFSER